MTPIARCGGLASFLRTEICWAFLTMCQLLSDILPLIKSEKLYHNQRTQTQRTKHTKSNKLCISGKSKVNFHTPEKLYIFFLNFKNDILF